MKKLSAIIINYNTCDLLNKCISHLYGSYQHLEIIVVDNGSTDGSADIVEKNHPNVTLIRSQNLGLAVGGNLGLAKATGDYILYLGTDAFPEMGVLEGMANYLENNQDVGIATAKLVTRDGRLDMDAHRGFPTPWASFTHFSGLNKLFPKSKIFNQYFLGYCNFDMPHEIDLCISHFMMVRKKVFEKVGKWDEDFFVYGEDVDFCYRTKQNGYKIMYLPQFTCLHYKGASVGIRKETKDIKNASSTSSKTRNRMRMESVRAMRLFYTKHFVQKYSFLTNWFVLGGIKLMELRRIYS